MNSTAKEFEKRAVKLAKAIERLQNEAQALADYAYVNEVKDLEFVAELTSALDRASERLSIWGVSA